MAGHETVLVVEDEPMVRAISVESLEMLGYRVLQASHGEEALEVARATRARSTSSSPTW